MSIQNYKKLYFIGLKGAGMTALAQALKAQGHIVNGSDIRDEFFTDKVLKKEEIHCFQGFSKDNVPRDVDAVVYSTAYSEDNEEIAYSIKQGIPMFTYPMALGSLIKSKKESIAIAGTHGKTTITALLGWVLEEGEKDPSVIIGAKSINWQSNARAGKSSVFVFEADEYQNKFQYYSPHFIVLTNIDFDHPDYFKDFLEYRKAFRDFIQKVPKDGCIFANYDHLEVRHIVQESAKPVIWYGEHHLVDWQLLERTTLTSGQRLRVGHKNMFYAEVETSLIGKHNALNCLPVIACAYKLGVLKEKIIDGLRTFRGTARRLEFVGSPNGITIIDDYAHHPREIQASINALREQYLKKKLFCVFQPHTYSRTEALLSDFSSSFQLVDSLVLVEIYGSAREQKGYITIHDLAKLSKKYNAYITVVATVEEAVSYLKDKLKSGDLLVTMGAGDTWKVAEELNKILSTKY